MQEMLPIGLNIEALEEWESYRQEKGKPLSKLARKKSINFLLRYDEEHQQRIVDAAIMNDWQGLHQVDYREKQTTRGTTLREDLTNTDWAH